MDKYNLWQFGELTHELIDEDEMMDILLDLGSGFHDDPSISEGDLHVEIIRPNGEKRFLTKVHVQKARNGDT
mgnify:CR=1 FL=1